MTLVKVVHPGAPCSAFAALGSASRENYRRDNVAVIVVHM